MVATHSIKINGFWYKAGDEISPAENKPEENKTDDFAQYMNEPVESEEVTYTKTEINRMSTADLKALAKSKDVEDAEKMSGAELKKVLIEKFGL